MKFAVALLLLMPSLLILAGCTEPPTSGAIAIVGARLEPSLDAEPIPHSVIVIENGKIVAAGPQQSTPVPKGAQTVQGGGFIVLPMPYNATVAPGQPANLMLRDAESGAPAEIMQDGQWIQQ